MKQSVRFFLQIAVILALWVTVIFSQGTQITIIHVNDSHSHLDGTGRRDVNLNPSLGGISRAAGVLFTLKATEPNPILLHAGDFCVGDFFFNKYFGVPELQILKQIGFDAMTVGNHEFDLGPSTLEMIYSEGFSNGSFPVVSANLDLSGFPSLSNYISPYTIKMVSGVKVGIFGMTIPAPLSNPSPVIINENIPEIAYATVTELQSHDVDVIICLSHLGYNIDSAVAANVPGINVIVGAHDHYEFAQPKQVLDPLGHTTYIVQAGSFYKNVGKLKITYHNGSVAVNSYELIPVTSQLPPVPEIENVINDLKQGIIAQYGDVYNSAIATASFDIENKPQQNIDGYVDSPLGNFIADAYLFNTYTKIAITANGLIADKLYYGPIVGADIFRTVGYGYDTNTGLGFNLYTCEIRGAELIKGLESSLSMFGVDNDFVLQISGFKYQFNPQNPVGQRVIIPSVLIGGKNIVMHKKYSLTVNEGLLGILLSMGIQVEKIEYTGLPEYTALVNFAGHLENISYLTEGRIQDISALDMLTLKPKLTILKEYRLYDNYPNPFNPVTTIKFEIPQNSIVNLKIYDILGREVARLIDTPLEAGLHIVSWDASRYASGIYFYSLVVFNTHSSAIEYTQSKRMILVK